MDAEQLQAITMAARRFAQSQVEPWLGTEGRDGPLEELRDLLDRAQEIGLLATPDANDPGYELGIWGTDSATEGPTASLEMLREVGRACAGVASCLHAFGLGAALVTKAETQQSGHDRTGRCTVAWTADDWRVTLESLETPPPDCPRLEPRDAGGLARGCWGFVPRPVGTTNVVLLLAGSPGWIGMIVPFCDDIIEAVDVGPTCGLEALRRSHLHVDAVVSLPSTGPVDLAGHFVRQCLGTAAVAVGNAQGAVDAAFDYARDRWQGGAQIVDHPAVMLLLGDAASRIDMARAHLASSSGARKGTPWRAAATKLRVTHACREAVSDCLQVLGGYGYMEDYRLEKRLRDAMTLETMGVRTADLRLICGSLGSEVGA